MNAHSRKSFLRRLAGNLAITIVSIFISLALLELCVYLTVRAGLLDINIPTYDTRAVSFFKHNYMAFYDPYIGKWQVPGATQRHKKICFDVFYTVNSEGMRDKEYSKESDSYRVAALGDSYMQGWGIDYDSRLTSLLRQQTGLEHMNFACPGLDPVQYLQVYRTRTSRYDHDAVVIGLFPGNDLVWPHNPPRKGEKYKKPFYSGNYPDYTLHLPNDLINLDSGVDRLYHDLETINIKKILRTFTYTYNAIIYVEQLIKERNRMRPEADAAVGAAPKKQKKPTSLYYGYTDNQWDLLRYILQQFRKEAGERPILLVTIPMEEDVRNYRRYGGPVPLVAALKDYCPTLGIDYVDLMENMPTAKGEFDKLIFPCDMHLSERGNKAALEVLLDTDYYREIGAAAGKQ